MNIKIAEINAFNFGSTGNIMFNIAKVAVQKGIEVKSFAPKARMNIKHHKKGNTLFGTIMERRLSELLAKYTLKHDEYNYFGTIDLLKMLKEYKPDIIHLHNLHGDYVNLKMLFQYIKRENIKVIWTLHDCWAFTGHCTYYSYINCKQWESQCINCVQYRDYPSSAFDDAKKMYIKKREWFQGVKNLTIVTPSRWLAAEVRRSFLKDYPVRVINNGIDLSVFCPTKSDFLKKYNIENKKIVLSVAFLWERRKGLDRLLKISQELDEDYRVVIVGTLISEIDISQIIYIPRTSNQKELAEIYTAANVFVNPTYEDTFGNVNVEALACGTPVLSFGAGGSAEVIDDNTGAIITEETAVEAIKTWVQKDVSQACVAKAQLYSDKEKFRDYVVLYREIQ